jgi:GNAT superfamily N-acetyltransferase
MAEDVPPQLTGSITLHTLSVADQPHLYRLMQRIYPPVYAYLWPDGGRWYVHSQYNERKVARELADETAAYYFVRLDGQPVGIVRMEDDRPLPERPGLRASKLHRLYLDPAIHGRGVGRVVMEWVSGSRRDMGYDLIWLEAMDTATAALAFYERMGFTITAPFTLPTPLMYPGCRGMYRMAADLEDAPE